MSSSRQDLSLPARAAWCDERHVVEDVGGRRTSDWICGRPHGDGVRTPPRPVTATVVVDDEALVLVVGAVDRFSWPHLEVAVLEALAAGARSVVLDARQLSFVDATVVSRLASVGRRLQGEGGSLWVASPPSVLRRLVDLLLLGEVLVLEPRP